MMMMMATVLWVACPASALVGSVTRAAVPTASRAASVVVVVGPGHATRRVPCGAAPLDADAAGGEARLAPLPAGINQYEVSRGVRLKPLNAVRDAAFAAIEAARRDGLTLCEVEFPPLLGLKTEFDDVDNVQILNANSDFGMDLGSQLAREVGEALWVAFADRKELELARESWPGRAYSAATLSTVEDVARALGGAVVQPWGAQFASFGEHLLKTTQLGAAPEMSAAPPPRVILAVQPGDGGPLEDWINLEACETDGACLVVQNGAFDKLRGGAYPKFIFPKLAETVERLIPRFEAVYYLKPITNKGRSAWIYRVYPGPWQIIEQRREDTALLATFQDRPTFPEILDILSKAPAAVAPP